MQSYTYSEARQNLKSVLDQALLDGEVLIRRKDGSAFLLTPFNEPESPLDVPGVKTDMTREEIVDVLREIRSGRRN